MALVVALALGWGIDHARLTRTGDADDDVELEVLKARARVIPQRDELPYPQYDLLFKSSELSPEELFALATPDSNSPRNSKSDQTRDSRPGGMFLNRGLAPRG